MSDFNTVTKREPCPVCGKPDWCARMGDGDRVKCERETMAPEGWQLLSLKDGGGVYAAEAAGDSAEPFSWSKAAAPRAREKPGQAAAPRETGDADKERPAAYGQVPGGNPWAARFKPLAAAMDADRWAALAGAFGLPVEACRRLRVGWADRAALASLKSFSGAEQAAGAWAFPEVDGDGRMVGLLLRSPAAGKRRAMGSKHGLTLAEDPPGASGPVLLVEGPSDLAAVVAMGCRGIGRPSNRGGADFLAELLGPEADVLVVGDRDPKPNGKAPGLEGARDTAEKLAAAWGRPVRWALVPEGSKDVRAWCTGPGAAACSGEAARTRGRELVAVLQAAAEVAEPPAPMGAVFRRFSEIEPREVDWLWLYRIPSGRLTLLNGRPGQGKSFLTAELAAHVTTGRPWPDGTPCPCGDVVMMNAEDDPHDTTRPRLDWQGADVARVISLTAKRAKGRDGVVRESGLTLADLPEIEQALDAANSPKLLVVDPVGSYTGGATNTDKDNQVRAVLAPLAKLAADRGVAVVVVTHTRKAAATAADDKVGGSVGFVGIARSVLHLMPDADDVPAPDEKRKPRRLLMPGKGNLGPSPSGLAFDIVPVLGVRAAATLRWCEGEVEGDADSRYAREGRGGDDGSGGVLEEVKAWLADLLEDAPMPGGEVEALAKAEGHSKATLRRAKKALGVEAKKAGPPPLPWLWWLPSKVLKHPEGEDVSAFELEAEDRPDGPGKAVPNDSSGGPVVKGAQEGTVSAFEQAQGGKPPAAPGVDEGVRL